MLKNEPNRCILRGVILKIRYRTNWPQKRDTPHSELKLKLTFWTTENALWNIYEENPQYQGSLKNQFPGLNSSFLLVQHVYTRNVPDTNRLKWRYVSLPISRKRLKEAKRHLQGLKYGSRWVQINKQIKNRFPLRGDIPTWRYRIKWLNRTSTGQILLKLTTWTT